MRIDRTILGKIQWLAKAKGIPISEYASEMLRPLVDREFLRESKKLQGGEGKGASE